MKTLITTVLTALLFSQSVQADNRTVIEVNAQQRDALLSEMRQMLASSQKIIEGLTEDDMAKIEKSARTSGMKLGRATPKSLSKILPAGFKVLGPKSHKGFEQIANEAAAFGDSKKILTLLSETQKACVACHQTYQIHVK